MLSCVEHNTGSQPICSSPAKLVFTYWGPFCDIPWPPSPFLGTQDIPLSKKWMGKAGKQGPLEIYSSSIACVHSLWENFLLSQLLNIFNITWSCILLLQYKFERSLRKSGKTNDSGSSLFIWKLLIIDCSLINHGYVGAYNMHL